MGKNIKNKVVTVCFIAIILGGMFANIVLPDAEVSYSERRSLVQVPSYSFDKLLSGELFDEYEKYFLDQFAFRDIFRGIKAFARYNIFNQKDNNGIYIVDGYISKIEYPLDEKAILNAANKFNEVYDKYLHGMNVYFSVIPDKNYFAAYQNDYLSMDYDRIIEILNQNVNNMKYIDLFDILSIDDYYYTDIHWRQDRILDAADKLLAEMGSEVLVSDTQYIKKELYPFYGSYYGQSALKLHPDTMVYLTNDTIENAVVCDEIDKTLSRVYMQDKFGTIDSYDFFLSGAKSVLTVYNPSCTTGRELVLFRDSFGSSVAPLLLNGYSKITLVDLRYMGTDLLGDYVEFHRGGDVLFLYNTIILNNSYMLK